MFYLGSGLRFHFKAEALADDSFNLLSFDVDEQLSSTFKGELVLLSRRDDIAAEQIVDKQGVLSIWQNGQQVRGFHGIVTRFAKADSGHKHTQYTLTIEPAMARLRLRHNSRIFQQKSLQQIFIILLDEMGITDYAFSWDARYDSEKREYCVQYRESDFDFITRLAAEAGVFWYVEFTENKHTLIFCDATSKLAPPQYPFPYNALGGGNSEIPFIRSFSYAKQLASAKVELKDYSFKKPAYSFLQDNLASNLDFQQAGADELYEHYDYPGRYKDDAQGALFAQARLQALRHQTETALAASDIVSASAGMKFNLTDHPDSAFNRDWLLVGVKHSGIQGAAAEEANSTTPTQYQNQLLAIEAQLPWLPLPATKPLVSGPQMAIVVGPKEEEIFCDEFGRVKVQFPWDRDGQANEHSSCWIRVSQGWAGGQYGFMAIPRIGHEVIVSFLEGDPDQPIITGRTYHAANPVPYELPDNKTKTVLRTQTHRGKGFNELSFEDQSGEELVYIHAQKDMQFKVENSHNTRVNYDKLVSIGHDEQHIVANNRTLTVEGKQQHATKGDYLSQIQGDKHESIAGDLAKKIEGAIGINAQGEITIKSGSKLTLQVGGSFVVIDNSGVAIDGAKILIKSGGSPGGLPLPSAPDALAAAAADGSAFVADCPEMS